MKELSKFALFSTIIALLAGVGQSVDVLRHGGHSKQRRSVLSIPSGSTYTITIDFIIPVVPLINTTLTYLWFDFPVNLNMPVASDLYSMYTNFFAGSKDSKMDSGALNYDFLDERRAHHDKRKVYGYVEGVFQSVGLDGQSCLQRTICELAETPLANHGLMGKLLHLLFSPPLEEESYNQHLPEDLSKSHPDLNFLNEPTDDEYNEAFRKGSERGGCSAYLSSCPLSIFKMLDL